MIVHANEKVECDHLLAPLRAMQDDASRERAIETLLLQHAQTVVMRILARNRSCVPAEDADDIVSTVHLRVFRRLQQPLDQEPIASFADYVAMITYNVINDYLRRRYPNHTRLKNRVRYVLAHDARFARWETKCGITAGLAAWQGREPSNAPIQANDVTSATTRDSNNSANAIAAIFAHAGAPMLLDDLVQVLAELWNVTDATPREHGELRAVESESPAAQYEAKQYLGMLWAEVRELRAPQRAALLLNLRDHDGRNALVLLLLAGIATIAQIAAAVGLDLEKLNKIWNELPLDDATIAVMLGGTRQQVINLRKAARERLSRRMKRGRQP